MKQIIAALLITFSLSAFGQKPDWGRIMQAESKNYSPVIVGEDDRAIYSVSIEDASSMFKVKANIRLEKFDTKNLNKKYSKLISTPEKRGNQYTIERVGFVGEKFLLFGSYYDNKKKTYELDAFTYDSKNGSEEDSYEIFTENVEKRRRKGDFDVHTSKNNEKMLVHFTTYYKETGISVEKIKLYDKEMKLLLEKEYKTEGVSGGALNNIIVDDEGSIYFIKSGDVVILDANQDFEEWSEPIEVEGIESNGFLGTIHFALNSDNDLVLVSRYITKDLRKTDEKKSRRDRKKDDTQVEGVYFMKINGFSKETEVSQLSMFDQEFLDQFLSEKDIRKGRDVEMNNRYKSFDFFFKEDGGVIFVSEEHYSVSSYRNDALVAQSFFYKDLVAFNFSPAGDLVWANRIPKNQRFYWQSMVLGFNQGSYGWSWWSVPMTYKGHFSYMAGLSEDKLFLVFNDNKNNIKKKNDAEALDEMNNIKKAVPCIYSIDLETGIKTKEMELSLVAANAYLKPSVNYQGSQDGALYIFGMKKKNFRYGKIEFGDQQKRGKKTARK